ncbi:MAG TPA: DUF3168 domain-containing protein [Xanthobacteraceae bacterium]|jgi:hypothetical protein|nr:DUF3168 domain-containing protein [Xanthobacteraceae bacterium]
MSDPSLALQQLIRARLSASTEVTTLVPATSIVDRNHRPEQFPGIIIGEGRANFADNVQDSYHDEAFTDLHIWVKEDGLATGKAIAGAVKDALSDSPWSVDGYRAINVRVVNARYMRDPDGQFSHTVLSIEAVLIEVVS